jgi:hypothetical protein
MNAPDDRLPFRKVDNPPGELAEDVGMVLPGTRVDPAVMADRWTAWDRQDPGIPFGKMLSTDIACVAVQIPAQRP